MSGRKVTTEISGEDVVAFGLLREYYRNNFVNGKSDESFLIWCEDMCKHISYHIQYARKVTRRATVVVLGEEYYSPSLSAFVGQTIRCELEQARESGPVVACYDNNAKLIATSVRRDIYFAKKVN